MIEYIKKDYHTFMHLPRQSQLSIALVVVLTLILGILFGTFALG